MVGHIKIDRKILEWEWYQDLKVFHLFLYLLLKANHKEGSWKGVKILRGQALTGRLKASKDTGLSEREIRTCLEKLKSTNEITIKSTSKYSLITICKYDFYQANNYTSDQQKDQQAVQLASNQRPTIDQQTTINNNVNNNKEELIKPLDPVLDSIYEGTLVQRMVSIFQSHNPNYVIEPEVHYAPCLQIAYRIAKMKKWDKKDVLNGKMELALKSWEIIVLFVKNDEWLSTRSLIDLNSNKEWDRLFLKMQKSANPNTVKESIGSPIKKEKEVDFDKYKKR